MRALATIRKVDKLYPIEGADRIEVCTMEDVGWRVVVKKDSIKPGDMVVYFEIDSVLPEEERYEFLRASSYKKWECQGKTTSGFYLRTIKLRGELSQGLVLPLSDFPELKDAKEGDDVTETLKVRLYDDIKAEFRTSRGSGGRGACSASKSHSFPGFLVKTDQPRIQNLIYYFETMKDVAFTAEQKYDGSSMTVFYADPNKYKSESETGFGVCSRNLFIPEYGATKKEQIKDLFMSFSPKKGKLLKGIKYLLKDFLRLLMTKEERERSTSVWWKAVDATGIQQALIKYCQLHKRNLAVQGELVGPKLNGNRDKYEYNKWFVFDVFDIDAREYMRKEERKELIKDLNSYIRDIYRFDDDGGKSRELEEVRTLKENWKVFNDIETLDQMLGYVDMFTERGNPMEGVVFKSEDNQREYVHFKCINNKYLLSIKDDEDTEEE